MENESLTITHAIVKDIVGNKVLLLKVTNIKEFVREMPQDKLDFVESKVYAGRESKEKPYKAVQILQLGSIEELEERLKQPKRFRFHKFNNSDYKNFDETSDTDIENNVQDENEEAEDLTDDSDTSHKSPSLLEKNKYKKVSRIVPKKKGADTKNFEKNENERIINKKIGTLQNSNSLDFSVNKSSNNEKINILEKKLQRLEHILKENEMLKKQILENVSNNVSYKNKNDESYEQFSPAKIDSEDDMYVDSKYMKEDTDSGTEELCTKQLKKKGCSKKLFKSSTPKKIRNLSDSEDEQNIVTPVSKKRKEHSDSDNDQNDSESSHTNMKMFQTWFKTVSENNETEQKVKMIYLAENVSIPKKIWSRIKKSTSINIFVKELARVIWGPEVLANRCLKLTATISKVSPRESPRKVLTPEKKNIIKRCLKYWLLQCKPELIIQNDIDLTLNKINAILTEEIGLQVKECKKNNQKKNYETAGGSSTNE